MNQEVLHILLVGFHHKKGSLIEFSYPSLVSGKPGSNECPESWMFLPTLTLPDLSHNFQEDTVFFTLPSLENSKETIYGCSCYRQISTADLKYKSEDITRSSVQKAVCALLKTPIFGYIEVKLTLIAQTFFEQGDFSNVDILIKAYDQLNACLSPVSPFNENGSYLSANSISHLHVGLGLRELMMKWRHKILLLFKLLLLEKKVIYFGSPVRPLCSLILSINSLHPQLLESGFKEVAYVKPSRPLSFIPEFTSLPVIDKKSEEEKSPDEIESLSEVDESNEKERKDEDDEMTSNESIHIIRETSIDSLESNLLSFCSIKPSEWLAPIPIFKNGFLCLPFVSLNYLELILDPSINGYVIGASNILFQQKMQLADVMIDVQGLTIETNNSELRQQLRLTTEDLRFVDYIMKNVQAPKETGEGGENWIREQFGGYFVGMLRTIYEYETNSLKCAEAECFNRLFFDAWKKTNNFQEWLARKYTCTAKCPNQTINFDQMKPAHPFSTGNITVADMRLKIAQSIHNTENGRKIIQAVNKFVHNNWFTSFSGSTNGSSSEDKPKDKSIITSDTEIAQIADEVKE